MNRAGGEILGTRALPSLGDVPEAPELVVLSVPAGGFEAAVDEALAAGARAIVGISAGLGELDEAGRDVEAAVTERVRAAGAVLLGPNCLGVFDADAELDLGWSALPAGEIALVSQSGNLALELARVAASAGLGFSRFVSLGNQADLVAADLLDELAAHARTRVIALYLEDFRDGRSFVAAAARARAAGTPIVVLPGGTTGSSARAALSHTGALVSDSRAIDAACAAAGIVRVATPTQLIDAAQALLAGRLLRGRRVAVYADGGGHGVVATDVLAAAGLDVPALSPSTTAALGGLLPATASLANPVDFAGGGERGLTAYADVGRVLLRSSDVDAVLLTGYFGGYGADTPGSRTKRSRPRRCSPPQRRRTTLCSLCRRRIPSRLRQASCVEEAWPCTAMLPRRRRCSGCSRRWRKTSRLRPPRAASRTSRRPGLATGPPVPSSPKQACR